ncbi:MAG: type II secretion system protein [Verrucomicrobiales bacterium]|nr:type II secretion system protein [Verrucomicrobiales bacterium]
MRHPTRNRAAGFSLVEVMCAILILGVGVAGLMEGVAASLRSSRDSRLLATAMSEAEGVIELLRAEGYIADGSTDGECSEALRSHRWRRTVSATDLEGLHDVEVRVEDGRTGKVVCELRTLVFEAPSGTSTGEGRTGNEAEVRRRERERRR